MGCFFIRLKPHPRPQNCHRDLRRKPPAPEAVSDRAPPPLEQECVKEVLSETHLAKVSGDPTQKMPVVSEEKIEAAPPIEKLEEVSLSQVSEMCSLSEVSQSQVSEMCSVSESFSTATTFTDKRDDEVMSKPSSDVAHRVGPARPRKRVPKSPARRAEPSPERKARAAAKPRARQQNAVYGGLRRDHGEASGRRSRSPVTRAAGGAGRGGAVRSPMKQTGRAGGRSQNVEGTPNGTVSESLENPHVSLECFIFL